MGAEARSSGTPRLRAAIDWSYDLLDSAEQRLLARLSVFSGGCTLEAIEEICSGDPVERDDVMDLVAGLVARSLVVAEDSDMGTRYRLLETIRQYGEERLADCGETEALQVRHAAFYAQFSAHAAEKTYGPDQLVWARQIKLERDNFLTALANAVDSGDASAAVELVASYPVQYRAEGPTGEVLVVDVTPVLGMPGASEQPAYPSALVVAAYKAQSIGDWQRVDELCRQALEAEERLGAFHGPRIEMETCSLQAQNFLATRRLRRRSLGICQGRRTWPKPTDIWAWPQSSWPTRSVVRSSGVLRPRKWSRR